MYVCVYESSSWRRIGYTSRQIVVHNPNTPHKRSSVTNLTSISPSLLLLPQLRELDYQLQQEKEAVRSGQAVAAALKEQMAGVEERLAREMEQRQTAELQRREAELEARSHLVLSQQLQDQVSEMTSRLQAEREAKAVQVTHTHTHLPLLAGLTITS